ncbi:MAG: hypothetical protein AAFN94_12640 [Pseudomonadota bacterium]
MKIYCASPSATDFCHLGYARTLAHLFEVLATRDIPFSYHAIRSSDVVLNRNSIAHRFLHDTDATHLMMLDTDMEIEPQVFGRFLDRDHPFVGAVYSRRKLDLDAFHAHARSGVDVATAKALASDFPVHLPDGTLHFADGFVPVTGIGMGCVLIARTVFDTIANAGGAAEIDDDLGALTGVGTRYRDYFGLIRGANGAYLSEDLSFCKRAVDTGAVEIMGYIGPGVHHLGQFRYSGAFEHVLKAASDTQKN